MTAIFGTVFSLDDLTSSFGPAGKAYDLGDGRVVYSWIDPATDLARVGVAQMDGTVVVSPQDVDAATFPATQPAFGSFQGVFAATPTSGGGFNLYYTVDQDQLFPPNGDRYVRSFDADGTPAGASTLIQSDAPLFTALNTMSKVLSDGRVAVASDAGLTILNNDGTFSGGTTGAPGFATTDNGFQIAEAGDGRILVVKATGSLNFSNFTYDLDIAGQYYTSAGVADGAAFTIKDDVGTPPAAQAVDWRVDMDILSDGRLIVAWIDIDADSDAGGIMATILNADGTVSVPEFRANVDATEGRQLSPQVYALDNGGFVISYRTDDVIDATNESPLWRIQQFDSAGNAVGASSHGGATSVPSLFGQRNTIINSDGTGLIIDEGGYAMPITFDLSTPPIMGDAFANNLIGTTGDDVIQALDGNDTLVGQAGDDTLDGGAGDDTVDYSAASGPIAVYLQYSGRNIGGGEGRDTLISIESIVGSAFDDRIIGDTNNNFLDGGAGNDVIKGKGGNDTLNGGAGDDTLRGAEGLDTLSGEDGNDVLLGLAGNDTLYGDGGDDFLYGGRDADFLAGHEGDDRLRGNRGDDQMLGGDGADDLRGGGNNDDLAGDAGNDFLFGDNGNDTLHGGTGNDALTGGAGVDTFEFNAGDGFDRIKDWEDGTDQIDLTSFGFTNFTTDVLSKASDASGNLRINFGNGDVLYLETFALADFDASDVILS